jgi:Holliday junction resolvase RusA-like endonuclease
MLARAKPKQSPLQGAAWPSEPFLVATLPLPPGVNASYKTVNFKVQNGDKKGTWVRRPGATPALEQFKKDAENILVYSSSDVTADLDVVEKIKASKKKIPLELFIKFYFKTLWLHDVDGCVKAAMDAVFKYLGLNDNTVVTLFVDKFADRDNPRCEISLSVCLERIEQC